MFVFSGFKQYMKKLSVIYTVVLLLLCVSDHVEGQTLTDADWFKRELAEGVVWHYYWFDNLYNSKQSISYIDVDLSNSSISVEFPYLLTGLQKTSSMIPAKIPGSVAGINGTYFNTSGGGGHRTYLRINNTEIPPHLPLFSTWGYEGGLVFNSEGDAAIQRIPNQGWSSDTTHPDIMACGPLLVIENRIQSYALSVIGSHCSNRHPRSAVGITDDNHLILITVDGRTDRASGMTCEELAETMKELGCRDALNYDGGGSTTLWGGSGEIYYYNGVLNYPSDNGEYDHSGERSCANAIAIVASATGTPKWDGRLVSKSYSQQIMKSGEKQTVSLTYKNIGSGQWTPEQTKLVVSRPESRISRFYDSATWPSSVQAGVLTSSVATGQNGTFTFVLKAPYVETTTIFEENFMLMQSGVGRIGPADNESFMQLSVEPMGPIIIESRPGGQNYTWYSDSGMSDTSINCLTPGTQGNIGMRYGSTYRNINGLKTATVTPALSFPGFYNVYVTWGAGSDRCDSITFHVNHGSITETFLIDQSSGANAWVQLGTEEFYFKEGNEGSVVMTNEDINVSGYMYIAAVKFEFVSEASSTNLWKFN